MTSTPEEIPGTSVPSKSLHERTSISGFDATANAPVDIPIQEKESVQHLWDTVWQASPNANTFVIVLNGKIGQPDPDDEQILAFCDPYKPDSLYDGQMKLIYRPNISHEPKTLQDGEPIMSIYSCHGLCNRCMDAFDFFARYMEEFKHQPTEDEDDKNCAYPMPHTTPNAVVHHPSIKSLFESSVLDCLLCRQVYAQLPLCYHDPPWPEVATIEMCWKSSRSGIKSTEAVAVWFSVTRPDWFRNDWNYANIFKIYLWPLTKYRNMFGDLEDRETTTNDTWSNKFTCTDSIASSNLARHWLTQCENNVGGLHDECNRFVAGALPTRLLDVGTAVASGILRLVVPSEHRERFEAEGKYITLSYCWGVDGASNLPLLTSQNLSERIENGLAVADLPRSFQDVLEVCSWFSIKWLWIDCLTILQDSTTDWVHEAENMASIYRNAALNVSIDTTANSGGRCFVERKVADVTPLTLSATNIDRSWWVTAEKSYQFDWMQFAPSFSRAWIHRERQLSRRVLHFTSKELIWECAGTPYASELFPVGPPFSKVFGGDSKYQSITKNIKERSPQKTFSSPALANWNRICEEFSAKRLTNPSDMPTVISTLAEEFSELVPGDVYIAGLWKSSFPESLLWIKFHHQDRRGDEYIAPTWSWLSLPGRIELRGLWRQDPILSIQETNVVPKYNNKYGALESGFLRVKGIVRKIHIRHFKSIQGFREPRFDLYVEDGIDGTIIERLIGSSRTEYDGVLCDCRPDHSIYGDEASYHCLFVSIELGLTKTGKPGISDLHALLLEPVIEDQVACEYKRVGIITFRNLHAIKMRYQTKEGNDISEESWTGLQTLLKNSEHKEEELKIESHTSAGLEDIDPLYVYKYDSVGQWDQLVEKLAPEELKLV